MTLIGGGAGAGCRGPRLHCRKCCNAAQHPVGRPLGARAAGHVLRQLVGPACVPPALPVLALLLPSVPPLPLRAAVPLAAGGCGARFSVLRVLGADAVRALAAVAAAAASAAAPAALAVAARAAAGAVAPGRGHGRSLTVGVLPP